MCVFIYHFMDQFPSIHNTFIILILFHLRMYSMSSACLNCFLLCCLQRTFIMKFFLPRCFCTNLFKYISYNLICFFFLQVTMCLWYVVFVVIKWFKSAKLWIAVLFKWRWKVIPKAKIYLREHSISCIPRVFFPFNLPLYKGDGGGVKMWQITYFTFLYRPLKNMFCYI